MSTPRLHSYYGDPLQGMVLHSDASPRYMETMVDRIPEPEPEPHPPKRESKIPKWTKKPINDQRRSNNADEKQKMHVIQDELTLTKQKIKKKYARITQQRSNFDRLSAIKTPPKRNLDRARELLRSMTKDKDKLPVEFSPDSKETPEFTVEYLLQSLDSFESKNMRLEQELEACKRSREGILKERHSLIERANKSENQLLKYQQQRRHEQRQAETRERVLQKVQSDLATTTKKLQVKSDELDNRVETLKLVALARDEAERAAFEYSRKYTELFNRTEGKVTLPDLTDMKI